MHAAVILGPGCSPKHIRPFQEIASRCEVEWNVVAHFADDRPGDNRYASERPDVTILFGGDGTIHRHLSELVEWNVPALVVPVGSGNDFARALGFRGVHDALVAWRRFCAGDSNIRAIDLGVIKSLDSNHYFCTVAGAGLDCEVARRANALPRFLRGYGGYALSVMSTVFRFAPVAMRILACSTGKWVQRSDRPTTLAAFANAPVYGDGMKIAPKAEMDDGQLDICLIGGINPFKLFCLFPTVYFGRHLGINEVEYYRADCVRVETLDPVDVYADGEYVCRTPVEIGVQAAALRVIVA
jgi:diacylglycerol kinase (ATP)